MNITPCPFEVGDIIRSINPNSLAISARVTEVTDAWIKADVIEGDNKQEPLQVFRAGWFLYQVIQRNQ